MKIGKRLDGNIVVSFMTKQPSKTELTEHWFVANGEKGHAKFKRFPLIPGLIAALRTYFEYERVSALSRRRRLGLD